MTEIVKYASGLRLAYHKLESTRSVSIGIFVGAGSCRETAKNNGISHFIEHMLFKGTERRTAFQIAEEMESIGTMINAFTARENTCFYTLSTTEHTEHCMDFLSDIFFHSTFEDSCMEKEKGVVLEEINMCEDDPADVCEDLILASVYGSKGLGQSILGPKKNIKKFKKSDIEEYMDKYYIASNVVIAVAGNVELSEIKTLVDKYFESEFIKKPKKKAPKMKDVEVQVASLVKKKDCEQANIAFAFPLYGVGDNRVFSCASFSRALGGNMSSRLFQKVREERGLVYDIDASVYAYYGKSVLIINFATAPGNVEVAVQVISEELKKLIADGFTDKEVNTCKEQYKVGMALSLESSSTIMRFIGKNALYGMVFDVDERLKIINSDTKEGINAIMREVLDMDKVAAAYVGKENSIDVLEMLKNGGKLA